MEDREKGNTGEEKETENKKKRDSERERNL